MFSIGSSHLHGGIRIVAALLLAAASAMLLGGCRQKELEIAHKDMCVVDVMFLWDNAPGASVDGMSLFFYPENRSDGGRFWRFDIAGEEGGPVELEEGVYTMIAMNNDLPGIELEQMSELSTAKAMQRKAEAADCLLPAGIFYTATVRQLTVSSRSLSYLLPDGEYVAGGAARQVRCAPDSTSVVFNVILEIAEGLDNIRSAEAAISGIGGGMALGSMQSVPCSVPLKLDLEVNRGHNTLSGFTTGFRSTGTGSDYELTVRLKYYAGGLLEKKFIVPANHVNTNAGNTVYLIFKNIVLPENAPLDPDAVGIGVGMDGWSVIEINLVS